MPAPNYEAQVAAAAARYPEAWRNAHTGNAQTEDFIRLLAADLHALDPNVGLNGKRGNPDDISDDALAVYTPDGSVVDRTGRRMAIIDVIAGAGGPNPRPSWQDVGGPSPGAWVAPSAFVPGPTPTPQPQPTPCKFQAVDLAPVLSALTAVINQQAVLERRLTELLHQQEQEAVRLDEINARVQDVRNALSNGLAIGVEGKVPTFGGSAKLAGVAKG